MNQCPYCNREFTKKDVCVGCGKDIKYFKKVHRLSCRYYNLGLYKAKRRDLTGAIEELKNSLKIDKKNTAARNLLGLVYSEMGEIAMALSQWIISTHFMSQNNIASEYINYFQTNPTRLELLEQSIKKYNAALKLTKEGGYDLAIIQLKKIAKNNPNYIKALSLLSLVLMKTENYTEARKYLKMITKVDTRNPLAITCMREIENKNIGEDKTDDVLADRLVLNARESFAPLSSYKEKKMGFTPWLTFFAGILLAMIFFMFVVVPGIRAKTIETKQSEILNLNETMAKTNAEFDEIKSENEELKRQNEELTLKNKELKENTKKTENSGYKSLIEAAGYFVMNELVKAADSLLKVDKSKLTDKSMINLYNQISQKVFEPQSKQLFTEGYNLYSQGKFSEAIEIFTTSVNMNPRNVDSTYFLGRSYDRLNDRENAIKWYKKVIDEFSNTQRAVEAKNRLKTLGV